LKYEIKNSPPKSLSK